MQSVQAGHDEINEVKDTDLVAKLIRVDPIVAIFVFNEIADLLGLCQIAFTLSVFGQRAVGPDEITFRVDVFVLDVVVVFPTRLCMIVVSGYSLSLLIESGNRYQAVVVLARVLDRLYSEKGSTEYHREHDHYYLHPPVTLLSVVNREGHRQRTDDQYEGVQAAPEGIEVITTRGESHRIFRAKHEIGCKESAKEQDLLHEEHPHPDRDALFLLAHVFELMLKPGLVIDKFVRVMFRHNQLAVGGWQLAVGTIFVRQLPTAYCLQNIYCLSLPRSFQIEAAFFAEFVCFPRNNGHYFKILGRRR